MSIFLLASEYCSWGLEGGVVGGVDGKMDTNGGGAQLAK